MKNSRILIKGYIDEAGSLIVSSEHFKRLGFKATEHIPMQITDKGIIISRDLKDETETVCNVTVSYIMIGHDICKSKGLMEPSDQISTTHQDGTDLWGDTLYRVCYFVEEGKLTIPLIPEQIVAEL